MSTYLQEAAQLAADTPRNRCPATDSLEVLDAHPELRLVLEDTWSDILGRVYREVPADRVSRWPNHLAKTFTSFLSISKDPKQVFTLLDLLLEIDADKGVVGMTLTSCRRRNSLSQAITYYERLVSELKSVTRERPDEEVLAGTRDVRCRPRPTCGEAAVGVWYLSDGPEAPEEPALSPCHRAELLHDPTSTTNAPDWIERQPRDWRRVYVQIQRASASDLPHLKTRLLEGSHGPWNRGQLEVLWDTYRIRRDYLRSRSPRPSVPKLSPTARKLISRIQRSGSKSEVAWVGLNLYKAMRGELRLPGAVSEPEWSIVFDAYRARKAQVLTSSH